MDSTKEVVRWSRDIPPAHFVFMVRSFSLLSETGNEKHESGAFLACDKKWKLCVYPKGNKKANGDNNISLYLQIDETDKLPLGWEVYAKFSLFIYDHSQDKYLTIQDGQVRRFHYMKTKWGFDQLLPLSTFNDPSNGYLVDDTFAFGAEILVVSGATKRECLSMVKDPVSSTYTWKMTDFLSKMNKEYIFSDEFIIEGKKWKLKIYPNGAPSVRGESLSLFLFLDGVDVATLTPHSRKLYAKFKFRVCNQFLNREHHEYQVEHLFGDPVIRGKGVYKFMPLKLLESVSEGFLINNTLIVEVEIMLLSKFSEF